MVSSKLTRHTPAARFVEDRADGEIEAKLAERDCSTYPIDDAEFLPSKVGTNVKPATEAYTAMDAHALRIGMDTAWSKNKVGREIGEVTLRKTIGNEIVGDAECVSVTGNDPIPIHFLYGIYPESLTGLNSCKARIMRARDSVSAGLCIEIISERGKIVGYVDVEADAIELRDGKIYMRLKRV